MLGSLILHTDRLAPGAPGGVHAPPAETASRSWAEPQRAHGQALLGATMKLSPPGYTHTPDFMEKLHIVDPRATTHDPAHVGKRRGMEGPGVVVWHRLDSLSSIPSNSLVFLEVPITQPKG